MFYVQQGLPSYDHGKRIAEVAARDLTQRSFLRDFVLKNRPLLIKRTFDLWPAGRQWKDRAYLKRVAGDQPIRVWSSKEWTPTSDSFDPATRKNYAPAPMLFGELIDRADVGKDEFLKSTSTVFYADSDYSSMLADTRDFPFLPRTRPREYPECRMFAHGNTFTDWHFHDTDETVTVQAVGRKRLVLAPPDRRSWNFFLPAMTKPGGVAWEQVRDNVEAFRKLDITVAELEEGDAIFIPAYWWHVADSWHNELGITVAMVFRSPLRVHLDMRNPIARERVRGQVETKVQATRARFAPLLDRDEIRALLAPLADEMREEPFGLALRMALETLGETGKRYRPQDAAAVVKTIQAGDEGRTNGGVGVMPRSVKKFLSRFERNQTADDVYRALAPKLPELKGLSLQEAMGFAMRHMVSETQAAFRPLDVLTAVQALLSEASPRKDGAS